MVPERGFAHDFQALRPRQSLAPGEGAAAAEAGWDGAQTPSGDGRFVLRAMIEGLRRDAPSGAVGASPRRLADHLALRDMQENYAQAVRHWNRLAMGRR